MPDHITQTQVNQMAWAVCDTFRGVVDAGQYKDYILVMLFLKYISDMWNDHVAAYRQRFGDDEARFRWGDGGLQPEKGVHEQKIHSHGDCLRFRRNTSPRQYAGTPVSAGYSNKSERVLERGQKLSQKAPS